MSGARRTIQVTKNYRLFHRHEGENRPLDVKKHRKLMESMKQYGYLPCFPVVCTRDKNGRRVIKDGQHRAMIAESLGLPVHWIEESKDFDVAVVNNAQKVWAPRDYAQKWAANGRKDYKEGLEFAEQHRVSVTLAFSLLSGMVAFKNISEHFYNGNYKVRDRQWAEKVVRVYVPMTMLSTKLRNDQFLMACMRACRVPEFDGDRLIHTAERCREKLVRYGTVEAYLDMMEEVYNFHRKQLLGLKAAATMAMRERNVATKGKAEKLITPTANGAHHDVKKPKAKTASAATSAA